ncbi:hypothetical protein BJ165DRAFT_1408885 [Panaeolus papilionaceus]|nr:hypothetical protein BJ165DRAFT_1408885 [Panaeolus papilionaceus]
MPHCYLFQSQGGTTTLEGYSNALSTNPKEQALNHDRDPDLLSNIWSGVDVGKLKLVNPVGVIMKAIWLTALGSDRRECGEAIWNLKEHNRVKMNFFILTLYIRRISSNFKTHKFDTYTTKANLYPTQALGPPEKLILLSHTPGIDSVLLGRRSGAPAYHLSLLDRNISYHLALRIPDRVDQRHHVVAGGFTDSRKHG